MAYTADDLDDILDAIENTSFGKTWGKYSRKEELLKDMAMSVIAPISLGINSAIITAMGAIKIAFNILPALMGQSNELGMGISLVLIGIGTALLAAMSPFLRAYNTFMRSFFPDSSYAQAPEQIAPAGNVKAATLPNVIDNAQKVQSVLTANLEQLKHNAAAKTPELEGELANQADNELSMDLDNTASPGVSKSTEMKQGLQEAKEAMASQSSQVDDQEETQQRSIKGPGAG